MMNSSRRRCLLIIFFFVYLAVAVSHGLRESTRTPFRSFPMLYFSAEDVRKLRSRSSGTHEKITRDIRAAGNSLTARPDFHLPPKNHTVFASKWNEVYGNNLCGFAMYCFLYPRDEKAFTYVRKFMDTMASYPDWYVASSYGIDEVPIGHSLYGFTTAFDMLYDRFDDARIRKYLTAIKNHSITLYNILSNNRHGWSHEYIHNHAGTNIAALLMGGLVVSVNEPEISGPWISEAKQHLDFALEILKHVTDGSLNEGVSYGSYNARGLITYVFLAKRHLQTDHTSNPWLKQHFWFYYETVLPGFQRTVGIGDANHNWFFGPCSQLVYLDNYVMKNGYGNWLADKIRQARPKNKPLAPSSASIYSSIHTEYIFYNASIPARRPDQCDDSKLHVYSDWGVVTYGAGQTMKKGNTFFSFKSGVPNGEGVQYIRLAKEYPTKVTGWKNFNSGHEHPDQNSFTFSPNGRYFITEALYGPKLTVLDNVYSFAPSLQSQCNRPWEGQIGECPKWLRYKEYEEGMRGDILTATSSGDMAFTAGEAAGVYAKSLGIASFFRGILLLYPEILVVVDSIRLRPGSKTNFASATFHNMLHRFKPYKYNEFEGAQVGYPEGAYKVFSMGVSGQPIQVSLHDGFQPQYLREGPTNYINVSFPLISEVTTVAHIFSGPTYKIQRASFVRSSAAGVSIRLEIKGIQHEINVSTASKTWSKKTSIAQERIRFNGFAGYARVRIGSKLHYFGYSEKNSKIEINKLSGSTKTDNEIFRYTLSKPKCFRRDLSRTLNPYRSDTKWLQRHGSVVVFCFSGLSIISIVVLVLALPQTKSFLIRKVSIPETRSEETVAPYPSNPFIFVSALPASGGDLLENVFGNPEEFLLLSSSRDELTIPVEEKDSKLPDLCSWLSETNELGIIPSGWLTSLVSRPALLFNQLPSTTRVKEIRMQLRTHPNPTAAIVDKTGFWMTKIPWIKHIVGHEKLLSVLVVRDPRAWIHAITTDQNKLRRQRTISSLVKAYDQFEIKCKKKGASPPSGYQRYFKTSETPRRLSEKLAVVWSLAISSALASSKDGLSRPRPIHVVRYEDLVKNAEHTASELFSHLGFPLYLRTMNNLTRLVRSEYFHIPYDGIVTSSALNLWRINLARRETQIISEICCPVMKALNYDCESS